MVVVGMCVPSKASYVVKRYITIFMYRDLHLNGPMCVYACLFVCMRGVCVCASEPLQTRPIFSSGVLHAKLSTHKR